MLQVKAKANNRAEILLYEEIGEYWGVGAKQFAQDIEALGNGIKHFDFRINSNGGGVFDATAMYNFFLAHKRKLKASLDVFVDGIAASSASFLAMVADPGRLHMAENAWMMIHDPWSLAIGTATEMRKEADLLDGVRDTIADTYQKRATISRDETIALMADETWLTAQEAVDIGFADVVVDASRIAAAVRKNWFKHPPAAIAAVPEKPAVANKRVQEMRAHMSSTVRSIQQLRSV